MPQSSGIGIKIVGRPSPGNVPPAGYFAHTPSLAVPTDMYAALDLSALSKKRLAHGPGPPSQRRLRISRPHAYFKMEYAIHTSPKSRGWKCCAMGAKSLPTAGVTPMPKNYLDGGLIIGDSEALSRFPTLNALHLA